MGDDYRQALRFCATAAEREHSYASASLSRVRTSLLNLRKRICTIETRSATYKATETIDAQQRLSEFAQSLDGMISGALESTSSSLTRKKAQLSKFTVTLFGNTKAGKSTIREAVMRGNGETIGKGAQRTTRNIRRYDWNHLQIVDTPGIGAYAGEEDREYAMSVIGESDVLLFLVTDSFQETSIQALKELRDRNKPVIFVLNVHYDLERPVQLKKFLESPERWLGEQAIKGHKDRIRKIADDKLGMRKVKIVPIHAQAAFFATRPEHVASADMLHVASGIDQLLQVLTDEVEQSGPIRRVQTILDDSIIELMDIESELLKQGKLLRESAFNLKDKFETLSVWLDGYIGNVNDRIEYQTKDRLSPLVKQISSFVDENIEKPDVSSRWQKRVEDVGLDRWMRDFSQQLHNEVLSHLEEFNRQVSVDLELSVTCEVGNIAQYDPWDVKRTLRWTSTGATTVSAIGGVAVIIGSANFWNPVGWIAGTAAIGTLALSWFFKDRETKLQTNKELAAKQLREEIEIMGRKVANEVKGWFYKNITDKLVRVVRHDTRQLYSGMFNLASELKTTASAIDSETAAINRRLLVRTGEFAGESVAENSISNIARNPGVRTKFTWSDEETSAAFCREVSKALNEAIDGIEFATLQEMIASALTPGSVSPEMVDCKQNNVFVRLPEREMGRAIGKRGHNVALANRLLNVRIHCKAEETT
ncbi:MAG: 50S ribosome-binding GTPase [Aestuariivita sp.]|nr:50S ribosome-binding GTPase [Aestuariivita sp.]MCY4345850.1 50S ribosome-binding GTPase [Aestuariivita sp.]